MIPSGSRTPGVDFSRIGLPPGSALRVEWPDRDIRPYVTHYHVFDSDRVATDPAVEWVLPDWAAIRLTFSDTPMRLEAGSHVFDPLPRAALYGVTSRALKMSRLNGVTVGMGITPLGWSRLFRISAERLRDRIVPLDTVWPAATVATLHGRVAASDMGLDIKPLLDAFLRERLGAPQPDDHAIASFAGYLRRDRTFDVATAARSLGLNPQKLRRLSQRYFGFPPKTMMTRARFLNSYLRLLAQDAPVDWSQAPGCYYDISHFQRDGRRFLGMSPRRFALVGRPYSSAVLRGLRMVARAEREIGCRTSLDLDQAKILVT